MRLRRASLRILLAAGIVGPVVAGAAIVAGRGSAASPGKPLPSDADVVLAAPPPDVHAAELSGARPSSERSSSSRVVTDAFGPRGRFGLRGTVTREGRPSAAVVTASLVGDAEPASSLRRDTSFDPPPVPRECARFRTADDGRFEFGGLPVGRFVVTAVASDGAADRIAVDLPALGGITLDLRPLQSLAGRVLSDDGSPVAGTLVLLVRARGESEDERTVAAPAVAVGPDGRFRLDGVAEGVVLVRFVDVAGSMSVSVRTTVPTTEEWVIRLPPVAWLRGRVLDAADRAPIVGAEVVLHRAGGGPVARSERTGFGVCAMRTRTDAAGAFISPVFERRAPVGVSASAPGYVRCDVDASGLDGTWELLLPRSGLVTGRVVTSDGVAVAGLSVHAVAAEPTNWRGHSSLTSVALHEALSAADGTFRIEVFAHPDVMLFAEGRGYVTLDASSESDRCVVSTGTAPGATVDRTIVVVPGITLTGRVVDEASKPVAGASIRVVDEGATPYDEPPYAGLALEARSDDAGRFAISGVHPKLAPSVRATALDGRTAQVGARASAGGGFEPVSLELHAFEPIMVHVVDDATGAPVPGAEVRVYPGRGEIVVTGADGIARVEAVDPENRRVSVRSEGRPSVFREIEAGSEVTIRLRTSRPIEGRVLFEDGTPIPFATVEALASPDDGAAAESGADGRFRIADAPVATSSLCARIGEPREIFLGGTTVEAGATDVTLRVTAEGLRAGGVRLLRVRDREGAPVAHVSVRSAERESVKTVMGSDGLALVIQTDGKVDGLDRLVVSAPLGERGERLPLAPALLCVPSGAAAADVVLSPAASIDGRVLDPSGGPLGAVSVSVETVGSDGSATATPEARQRMDYLAGIRDLRATTDADGRFVVTGLPDGTYRLHLQVPADFRVVGEVEARAGTRDLSIRLARAVRVTIRAVDSEGDPVARVKVELWEADRDETVDSGETDSRGRAEFLRLDPDRPLRVFATATRDRGLAPVAITEWRPADTTLRFAEACRVEGDVVDPAGHRIWAWVEYRQAETQGYVDVDA